MTHNYEIATYWDETDKIYVAGVPDLPGCLAHGKTPVEAVENANKAIELWLEIARKFNDPIPESRPGHFAKQYHINP